MTGDDFTYVYLVLLEDDAGFSEDILGCFTFEEIAMKVAHEYDLWRRENATTSYAIVIERVPLDVLHPKTEVIEYWKSPRT